MRVMTFVGTRPEIIRLSRVVPALQQAFEHRLVHTGQNYDYELNQIFFEDLELSAPNDYLDCAADTAAETVGQIIARSDRVLREFRPDAVLILGDTNSCLAAYSAKRLKIPVFHMEAGNRCFDQRVPEEINRKLVDHIADINLPYSQISREYLIREGIAPDRIIKTGSPMFEVLNYYKAKIQASPILAKLKLKPNDYYLISCHREENVDDDGQLSGLLEILNGLANDLGKRVIVSTHPRTRKRLDGKGISLPERVELLKPLAFSDYVKLELEAIATLSDSGTITEESSILNFPALNIRNAHERPEGMEEGAVMMTGLNWTRVKEGLEILKGQRRGEERDLRLVKDYDAPAVSLIVVRAILSYTDYINRFTWHKPVDSERLPH